MVRNNSIQSLFTMISRHGRIVPDLFLLFFYILPETEQTNPVRGMKDRFGEENRRFKWIVDKGAHLSSLYGFEQVRVETAVELGSDQHCCLGLDLGIELLSCEC